MDSNMTTTIMPLPAADLCVLCDPGMFDFRTTDEVADLSGMVGQERALEAIRFGVGIGNHGYNLFVLGPSGVGKHTAVKHFLQEASAEAPVPQDVCYVNNFVDNYKPRLIRLPAGKGAEFRREMLHLLEELQVAIPSAFESEEYQHALHRIEEGFDQREQEAMRAFAEKSESQQVKLIQRPGEFTFAPIVDNKILNAEDFAKLPRDEQKRIETLIGQLQQELQELLQSTIPQWRRERREQIKQLNYEFTRQAVGGYIDSIRNAYKAYPAILAHLDAVEQDVIENVGLFLRQEGAQLASQEAVHGPLKRYEVNLLVDHSDAIGAPVVYADNPTYPQLFGRIEHVSQMGALVTDFTLIRGGDMHRANGGYLIVDARKLLMQPFAWETLKRMLVAKELKIESLGQSLSLISTVSLEPEPVPMDLKVVLLGDRLLYYMLYEYDPDFGELFKVAADFEDDIERSPENYRLFARLVATLARKHGLDPFDREAVAAVIDYSAREAADHARLSMHMRSIADLMQEANYWAQRRNSRQVGAQDIRHAIDARIERVDRIRDRMQEEIRKGVVHIDTDGTVVGQVNGLTVLELGNFRFSLPARITAVTRLGEGEVVNIEREVDLSGPIHSKGVFILSSYVGMRYLPNQPLSLNASLAFEQSYGGIEGDSASLAELCALLSSLARVGLRQDLALTGSVDQYGNVQAIGGVNEKIEGFFEVCLARGLTGRQGVIIPVSNAAHLMLRPEVIQAAERGEFAIYAVRHVDDVLTLLTGMPAGEPDAEGLFSEDSVNRRIQERLAEFVAIRHVFGGQGREGEGTEVPTLPTSDTSE